MYSILTEGGSANQSCVADSETSMSKSEKECDLPVVFRFTDDGLNFFFTEGDSWIYFDLRSFDGFRRVRRDPFILDAEFEKGTKAFKLFTSRSR